MGRRAEATRDRLRACALELFLDGGFDQTTVEDIASAAGVSQMTFFRHFPTKQAVLLEDPYDEVIARAVVAQDRSLTTLERVRRGFLAAWADLPEPATQETHARVRIMAGHPGLRASAWENNRRTGDLVTEALVADGVPLLEARVATGACLGALVETLLAWGSGGPEQALGDLVRHALAILALSEPQDAHPVRPGAPGSAGSDPTDRTAAEERWP